MREVKKCFKSRFKRLLYFPHSWFNKTLKALISRLWVFSWCHQIQSGLFSIHQINLILKKRPLLGWKYFCY